MTLGERIRHLRKERKMTLQQLAGDAITKGMLSLIENNKAKPSMESLLHIATMLEVSVSDLLEESSDEKKELVKKVEDLYAPLDYPNKDVLQEIVQQISPYLPSLTRGYIDARLLDLYSRAAYEIQLPDWDLYAIKSIQLYEENQIGRRSAALKLFRILTKFREKHYRLALDLLLEERKILDENSVWTDPLSRLDFDYTEAIFYYAVGDKEKALETMHGAIEFSKSQKIFYRLDNLYRLAAIHAIMDQDKAQVDLYINRLEAYANFTDDKETHNFICFLWIHYYTTYEKDFVRAEKLMGTLINSLKSTNDYDHERVEMAKIAYHKGENEEAMRLLEKNQIPHYVSHPIDLSIYSERDYYLAKIYMDDGRYTEARELVEISWQTLQTYPETPYQLRMKELRDELREIPQ